MHSIIDLDPSSYQRHAIHGDGRSWAETNCYMDVVIELIHSLGFEPVAALPVTVSVDFEVDQWTFYKFPHCDLYDLFGLEIQELNPWISVARHVEEQVNAGRPVLVELDSYYLPDTAGSAYKSNHVKSTVAITEIDVNRHHMGYFHGQAYYHLDGEDFRDIFQLDGLVHPRMLPPYVELVKIHRNRGAQTIGGLVEKSIEALRRQLGMLPAVNPFETFRTRFEKDIEWLGTAPIETFHGYSFATLRQYGACFELVETYLTWLSRHGHDNLGDCINRYRGISTLAKTFQFKLARTIARKKQLDLTPLDTMAENWELASKQLIANFL